MSAPSATYVAKTIAKLAELSSQAAALVDDLGELGGQKDCDSESDAFEMRLAENLKTQCGMLCAVFEKLGQAAVAQEVRAGFKLYEKNLTAWEYEGYTGYFWSPAQSFLNRYIDILHCYTTEDAGGAQHAVLRIFENILASTAMLLEQQKIAPQNETEINRFMKKVVSAAFPDTTAPSIPTTVKTYKPEFGVPSLAALAEYKFADTEAELKQCLDGILADSRGYQADTKWQQFYAVIFMTGAFFTPAQIDEQFKQCGIHDSWKAIVLVGKGGRKRTNTTAAAVPAAPATPPPPTPAQADPATAS